MSTGFKFRSELSAHSGDVRSICCPQPGLLLSASRDFTVRSWNLDANTSQVSEGKVYSNHTNYVSAVTYLPPSSLSPQGLILTASNDRIIRAFNEVDCNEPVFVLHGHTEPVCALAANDEGLVFSGSWDSTAKIWNHDLCLATLRRPGATIWSVIFLPSTHPDELYVATGSSDSVIALWRIQRTDLNHQHPYETDKPTKTLLGHMGCVRSLALLDPSRLLSASNDGSLRCWDLSAGVCTAEFYGHTNFVYSVAVDPRGAFIVSSGEDRTVRVWPVPKPALGCQQIECEQTISLPCQTAWCVAVTADGDIAVGCSDKKIRLFSQNPTRQAPPDRLQAYENELAHCELSAETLPESLANERVPGIEALLVPGKKDGHVSVIREDSKLVCYQWSANEDRWLKVGDVVGSAADSATGSNRTLFEGREYDFVFTVDFDESMPPVKLPYNKTDDPWLVAQNFLYRHNLPQDYLDTVAKYIIKNAGLTETPNQKQQQSTVSDPFTGGGRYVPGSTMESGSTRERTQLPGPGDLFPATDYITLESTNVSLLLRKLTSFNETATTPLSNRALELVSALDPRMSNSDAMELTKAVLDVLPGWKAETAFPLFDLLRCLVRWPGVSAVVFEPASWSNILQVSDLQNLLDSSDLQVPPPTPEASNCILFVLRLLANCIAIDSSTISSDAYSSIPTSIVTIVRLASRLANLLQFKKIDFSGKKHHQVAMATLLHNLSVFAHFQCKSGHLLSVLPALRGLPGLCTRMATGLLSVVGTDPGAVSRVPPEVVWRLLTALGTAIVTSVPDPAMEDSEKILLATKSQRIRLIGSAVPLGPLDDELAGWGHFRQVLLFWAQATAAPIKNRECASSLLQLLE
uniref:Phospholipase A-2-activating protein n=1 Tax=Schistocephalus solidus TaxID=70667 RepID=A0A0X3QGJ4_SCHSO